MKQVITIFLERNAAVEAIRKKYVSHYEKFTPHITLVYPFEYPNQTELKNHIFESLNDFEPFDISLAGLQKSVKGYYLYLLVANGKENIERLHERLNSGILDAFRNSDMPCYIAHLSLGIFNSEEERELAMADISQLPISFKTTVSSIQLVTITENQSLHSKEDFYL